MMAPPTDYITLVETFELKVPLDEFTSLVRGVMSRLEREAVAGLVSMQFYAGDAPGELGAVIRFADRTQFRAHVDMISSWDEFKRFAAMIRLVELRVFGELDPAVETWMRQFDGPIRKLDRFVAGFVRQP